MTFRQGWDVAAAEAVGCVTRWPTMLPRRRFRDDMVSCRDV